MTDSIEWAAGLFEGEGFTVRRPVKSRVYLEVGMETTDRDVLERFVRVMRANGIAPESRASGPKYQSRIMTKQRSKRNPRHKDIYTWKTTGNTGIAAYELMRPYLGVRRRNKADAIVSEARKVAAALDAEIRVCPECGQEFALNRYGRTRKFCTAKCLQRARERQPGFRAAANARDRRHRARLRARAIHPAQTSLDVVR